MLHCARSRLEPRPHPPGSRRPGPGAVTLGSAAAGLIVLLAGCGSSGPAAPGAAPSATHTPGTGGRAPAASQAPGPAESNPPRDTPDTTVYVPYQSAAGH